MTCPILTSDVHYDHILDIRPAEVGLSTDPGDAPEGRAFLFAEGFK